MRMFGAKIVIFSYADKRLRIFLDPYYKFITKKALFLDVSFR